jgi:hypothetical protein
MSKMPKKKNTTKPVKELKLNLTGKATFVVELEDYGPIEYRINDKGVVVEMFRLLIEQMGPTTPVDSYDARVMKKLRTLLDF